MAAPRSMAFVLAGLAITGCSDVLPKPEYSYVKTPPPIRTLPDGTRIDDRGYHLDADGYRLDRQGKILGEVQYDSTAQGEVSSNAVAGYYISSTGKVATGTVAVPSEGARAGAGYGPGSANPMPSGTGYIAPSTSNVPPPASTAPVPLAPEGATR